MLVLHRLRQFVIRFYSVVGWLWERVGHSAGSATGTSPTDTNNDEDGGPADGRETETLTEQLVETGIFETGGVEKGLRLNEEFRAVWWRRIRRYRTDDERLLGHLGAFLSTDPDRLETVHETDGLIVREDSVQIGSWPSHAAFLADIALYPTIEEWFDGWESLDGESRAALLARLRTFLEECPDCGGHVQPRATYDPDARGTVVSMTCTTCESTLATGWRER
jgi:hypothetical protein